MNEVLEEIIKDQEINVSDDGIQTISVLAEAQVDLEEQIEERNNQLNPTIPLIYISVKDPK